jgi:alpha-tubulin suppressor-like RCC1 family protein
MRGAVLLLLAACGGNSGPEGLLDVATSGQSSAVVDSNGTVWAWGRVDAFADGVAIEDSTVPVHLDGFRDGEELCLGPTHGLLRLIDGAISVWTFDTPDEPYLVQSLFGATALACSSYTMVAIDDAGVPWILSAAGTSNAVDARITIDGLPPVVSGACGESHCAFIDDSGGLWTWGDNDHGQLGSGTTTAIATPYATPLTSGVEAVAVGGGHTVALANDELWGWGQNDSGQLGLADLEDRLAPTRLDALSGVTHIAAGRAHSVIRFSNRTVATMGANDLGQLGTGSISTSPTIFPGYVTSVEDAVAVWAAGDNTLADTGRGFVGWGDNTAGQLGTDSFGESGAPLVIGPVGE